MSALNEAVFSYRIVHVSLCLGYDVLAILWGS